MSRPSQRTCALPGFARWRRSPVGSCRQNGVALLAMLTLLALAGLFLFVGQLDATQFRLLRDQQSVAALAEARAALIGDGISQPSIYDAGYLRLPDLGEKPGPIPAEGEASVNFAGNNKDLSVVGKFPWQTLRTSSLRDAHGECLWYVLSGRFKIFPLTGALNWDTQGQIDVIDAGGNVTASNLAALLVAPGRALDGQIRDLADAVYSECGGNYDARNYLDAFDGVNAIAGEVNYFAGINHRVAPDTGNKRFVLAETNSYNDRFAYVTVDDIFNAVMQRSDFRVAIQSLLDDPDLRKQVETGHPETVAVSSGAGKEKGSDNIDCNLLSSLDNRGFCRNWKEMLWLTALALPSSITIDGALTVPTCARVLIFAGRKAAGQSRRSALDKTLKGNYLEGTNVASFEVPMAIASDFSGASMFDYRHSSTDLIRCLP